jgi:hypothetical protein
MWGKHPFVIADNCALDVRDLAAATAWYIDKLEDSGRPFVDLQTAKEAPTITLVELEPGGTAEPATTGKPATAGDRQHVIFFAKKLEQAREWLSERGVTVGPLTTDSGGNRLFVFWDLEGHAIEVCIEPG